ncbi:MAG: DUF2306 domain-containing protein [Rhodospirillaceae bacterium]
MKILSRPEWTILLFILIYSFIPAFGGLFRILELTGGPAIAPENPRALAAPLPIVLHILSSSLFCLLGAVQFLPSIKRHRPATHRAMGRVTAIAGCASAATGVWMTHYYAFPGELQGNMLYWARITLGLLMFGLIGWAVIAIMSGNIFQHSASMVRAYAIGQGASTQTFLGIGWIIVAGTEPLGPLRDGMMVSAWVLNLLVAEYLIGKFLPPKKLAIAGSETCRPHQNDWS